MEITKENSVTWEDAEMDFEVVCARVHGNSPVFILKDGKPDLVVFDFHDYMDRFGRFMPKEEYEQLKKLEAFSENDCSDEKKKLDQP